MTRRPDASAPPDATPGTPPRGGAGGGAGGRDGRRPTADDGVVVVDKPAGWTSHDVVARMRRLAGTRKVGHAGTLDPMATGVLVVGIGRATRLLTYVVGADKEYRATIRLGVATTTDDAEGETVAVRGVDDAGLDPTGADRAALLAQVGALTGDLQQVPSAVSAIKVDGQRAYARVRAGETVRLAARPVTVSRFVVEAVRPATGPDGVALLDVDATVVVSSGTYVRALARDLGAALGVGGHLTALRRTRVGGFTLGQARTLDEVGAVPEDATIAVLPLADAARATMPARDLTEPEARALSYGQSIARGAGRPDGTVAGIGPDGRLVALLEPRGAEDRPVLVMAPA